MYRNSKHISEQHWQLLVSGFTLLHWQMTMHKIITPLVLLKLRPCRLLEILLWSLLLLLLAGVRNSDKCLRHRVTRSTVQQSISDYSIRVSLNSCKKYKIKIKTLATNLSTSISLCPVNDHTSQFTFNNKWRTRLRSAVIAGRCIPRRCIIIQQLSAFRQQQWIIRLHTPNAPFLVFNAEIIILFQVVFLLYFKRDFDGLGLFRLLQDIFCGSVARNSNNRVSLDLSALLLAIISNQCKNVSVAVLMKWCMNCKSNKQQQPQSTYSNTPNVPYNSMCP